MLLYQWMCTGARLTVISISTGIIRGTQHAVEA